MIRALRKRHLAAWIIIALLLPILVIVAWNVIPKPVYDMLLQPPSKQLLPVIVTEKTGEEADVVLRTNENKNVLQLQWTSKKELSPAAAFLFQKTGADSVLLGTIDGRGTYAFDLRGKPGDTIQIAEYDGIHHQLIQQLKF